jgi:hypothetical protein
MEMEEGKYMAGVNLLDELMKKIGADRRFLEAVADKINFAKIWYIKSDAEECKEFSLHPEHTRDEAMDFVCSLDFEYNCGSDIQEVYGTITFKDGSWLERCQYCGWEGWELKCFPTWESLQCMEWMHVFGTDKA